MIRQSELFGTIMMLGRELVFTNTIVVPGDVIESNAHEVDGRKNIWRMDATSSKEVRDEMGPVIVLSADGLKVTPIPE